MGIPWKLSVLALRGVAVGACQTLGFEAGEKIVEGVGDFLTQRFVDHSRQLTEALQKANERAWKVLEIALAGESFWERCKIVLAKREERVLGQQIRTFLDQAPLTLPQGSSPEFRQQCLEELRKARKAKLLTGGALSPEELAREAGAFVRYTDPNQLLQAEWQAVEQLAADFAQGGYPVLGQLLSVRPPQGLPLLVMEARYFFRREVETDQSLFQGLAWTQLETLGQEQQVGFAALDKALTAHHQQMEDLLADVRLTVEETHSTVLRLEEEMHWQNQQVKDLSQAMLDMLQNYQLQQRELRPRDSLSIRNEGERQAVKALIARYRTLPEEQRRRMPALLHAVGKLEVVNGDFQAAQRDFQQVAALLPEAQAGAEAHYNAYRAALEQHDWSTALQELVSAVKFDAKRFAPFPMGKYQPQRILGAGGFGVVFRCRHKYMDAAVVVKALMGDDLAGNFDQVFAEAQVLRQLDHPSIIRIQDCGYVEPARKSRPFLVMDFFAGQTLEEFVEKNGPLSAEDLLVVMRPVILGMEAAHAKHILHRDIKPANLLVIKDEEGWQVKIIDFGLALRHSLKGRSTGGKVSASRSLVAHSIAGTIEYASPEQMGRLPGVETGTYSDIYGFGKTCSFALFQTTQPLLKHWQSLPPPLAEFLENCLEEDPQKRPYSFANVLEQLTYLERFDLRPRRDQRLQTRIPTAPSRRREEAEDRADTRKGGETRSRYEEKETRTCTRTYHDEAEGRFPRKKGSGFPILAVMGGGVVFSILLIALGIFLLWGWGREKTAKYVPPPPANDPNIVFLSDLPEFDVLPGPEGWKFSKNGDLGNGNQRIMVQGQFASKGLSMHPPAGGDSGVKYRIAPAESFHGQARIVSPMGSQGNVVFEVLGDGVSLWRTLPFRANTVVNDCHISVKGVEVLELRVHSLERGALGNFQAWAAWIDPYIVRPAGEKGSSPSLDRNRPGSPVETPPPNDANRVYLSDLPEFDIRPGPSGWNFGKNGNLGDPDHNTIKLDGKFVAKGLGMHPPGGSYSGVKYRIAPAESFHGQARLLNQAWGDVAFEILGDGVSLWKTQGFHTPMDIFDCHISLKGIEVLELRVHSLGSNQMAWAVWIDPYIVRPGPKKAPATTLKEPGRGPLGPPSSPLWVPKPGSVVVPPPAVAAPPPPPGVRDSRRFGGP